MSLLNQVLQDLEKRNIETENTPAKFPLNTIKAVSITQKKTSVISLLLLFITVISLVILLYRHNQAQDSMTVAQPATSKVHKQQLKIPPADNSIDDTQRKHTAKTPPISKPGIAEKAVPLSNSPHENKPKPQKQPVLQKPSVAADIPPLKKPLIKKILPLSNQQKAQQLFTSVKKHPPTTEKINALKQAINLNIQHIKARLLLANTLLQLGLTGQAATLLDQSLILFPQNLQFINLRSQLFLQNKQANVALVILQQIDASYVNDEMYLSLLASAYQQNNQHSDSLQNYQKLLKIDSRQAKYWLGLAIAQDKLGNKQQAISAYQQALNKNPLKAVIVSYIKQRISALK